MKSQSYGRHLYHTPTSQSLSVIDEEGMGGVGEPEAVDDYKKTVFSRSGRAFTHTNHCSYDSTDSLSSYFKTEEYACIHTYIHVHACVKSLYLNTYAFLMTDLQSNCLCGGRCKVTYIIILRNMNIFYIPKYL